MRRIVSLLLASFFATQTASSNPVTPSGLIPDTGPYDSFAVLFNPEAMQGIAAAAGADYLRPDGRRLGALLAAEIDADFEADRIASVFSEGVIIARRARVMAGATFDVLTIQQEDGSEVFAIQFTAFAENDHMMADGDSPFALPSSGDAFYVVAWAESEEAAALLIGSSLGLISEAQTMGFVQDAPTSDTQLAVPSAAPNPFVRSCNITVSLSQTGTAQLEIFDTLGRRVAVLASAQLEAGVHEFALEATDLPAGVYLAKLVVDGRMSATPITKLR